MKPRHMKPQSSPAIDIEERALWDAVYVATVGDDYEKSRRDRWAVEARRDYFLVKP